MKTTETATLIAITKQQFRGVIQLPGAPSGNEVAWLKTNDGSIYVTIVHDRIDDDYACVLLGKDERGTYRCFDMKVSLTTISGALAEAQRRVKKHWSPTNSTFPQGD